MTMTVSSPSPEAAPPPTRDWRQAALCSRYDPELWQPVGSSGPAQRQAAEAKALCALCPSVGPCARWALDRGEPVGIWGGLTEDERRDVLERRAFELLDAPPEPERESNPLDDLSPDALEAALATGPRDAVPEGTPLRVRSELTRSRLFTEFLGSRKASSPGGVRWSDAGREALSAFRERERPGTRVTEQLGLPIGVSS